MTKDIDERENRITKFELTKDKFTNTQTLETYYKDHNYVLSI